MSVNSNLVMPTSILDTDLYKFTMQQAVFQHFPHDQGTYRFTHRDKDVPFTRECIEIFTKSIDEFSRLSLTASELAWLQATCPYLKPAYLDYLSRFRFKPEQVKVTFRPLSEDPDEDKGHVEIEAVGPWSETILWEVPLMACLSELYFRIVDKDWDYDGQVESAYFKAQTLLQAGCIISEFGTRRRRSYHIQDLVVETLIRASKDMPGQGKLAGTSNVHLAHKHGITPVGTIAHEWFMGVAAIRGYPNANSTAMELWEAVYPNSLLVALTDTFSTEVFYKDFVVNPARAKHWTGLRQDSGNPLLYAPRAKEIYTSLNIDHRSKTIIYSDALNVEKALKLKKQCDEIGFVASFGIGTSLTNDFYSISSGRKGKSRALNMVIKLASVSGNPCVKISDELTKNTGDATTILKVKQLYGINVESDLSDLQ